jgi:predicted RNA binding protein YcfA (HicA-like mRNA interferase family)
VRYRDRTLSFIKGTLEKRLKTGFHVETSVMSPTTPFGALGKKPQVQALRREIQEGLNVIEQWNGANDFVFFARRGELASNRREDHEVSMLSLHLLPEYTLGAHSIFDECVKSVYYGPWEDVEGGRMDSRDIIKELKRDGWYEVNQVGSHKQFKHPTKKGRVTVPHPKRDIPIGTLKSIEKQAGVKLR